MAYFFSCAINPFLYSIVSKKFRTRLCNGCFKKLTVCRVTKPSEQTITLPSHRRNQISFPGNRGSTEYRIKLYEIYAPKRRGALPRKAMHRHLGLPLSSTKAMDASERSAVGGQNMPIELTTNVHKATADPEIAQHLDLKSMVMAVENSMNVKFQQPNLTH